MLQTFYQCYLRLVILLLFIYTTHCNAKANTKYNKAKAKDMDVKAKAAKFGLKGKALTFLKCRKARLESVDYDCMYVSVGILHP